MKLQLQIYAKKLGRKLKLGIIKEKIRFLFRDIFVNAPNRKRLKNKNFSIICNDCVAGCVCKDLKIKMNSPTRNFYFEAEDFIKFCSNLPYYLTLTITEDLSVPPQRGLTGKLEDIRLFLLHYHSLQQAQEEWERRKSRVNFDNIFLVMNDRNNCTEEHIKAFNALPYPHKICFTHVAYPRYGSTYVIPGSEKQKQVPVLVDYVSPFSLKKHYDAFDFVAWLNSSLS